MELVFLLIIIILMITLSYIFVYPQRYKKSQNVIINKDVYFKSEKGYLTSDGQDAMLCLYPHEESRVKIIESTEDGLYNIMIANKHLTSKLSFSNVINNFELVDHDNAILVKYGKTFVGFNVNENLDMVSNVKQALLFSTEPIPDYSNEFDFDFDLNDLLKEPSLSTNEELFSLYDISLDSNGSLMTLDGFLDPDDDIAKF